MAWPPKITEPWLMSDSSVPTSSAIGMHRESEVFEKTSTDGGRLLAKLDRPDALPADNQARA